MENSNIKERYDIKKVALSLDELVGSLNDFYKDIINLEHKMRSFYKLFNDPVIPPCEFLEEEYEDNDTLTVADVLGNYEYYNVLKNLALNYKNYSITIDDFSKTKVITKRIYSLDFKEYDGRFYMTKCKYFFIKNGDDYIEIGDEREPTSIFSYDNNNESAPQISKIRVFSDEIMEALPMAFEKIEKFFKEKASKYRSLTK